MASKKFKTLAQYEISDPHPLVLQPGEQVNIIRHDSSWTGWIWVESGKSAGWAPESIFDTPKQSQAKALQAFNGHELSAAKGEILTGLRELSGWIWCEKTNGEQGWFPLFNLKPLEE